MDKYYEKIIYDITHNASDREQLLIIQRLVDSLYSWQIPYESGTPEEIYATNLAKIKPIIAETLRKEEKLYDERNMESVSERVS